MELLLFDRVEADRPSQVFRLVPDQHRTYHYWHLEVPGLQPGQLYAWRAQGLDPHKVLLDPYARAVAIPQAYNRQAAARAGDNCATAMKSVVVDRRSRFDWQGDVHPRHPFQRTVLYEMHLGGFTANPNSGVPPAHRGRYAGLIDKIPYLQQLGVTAVELLPVYHFDPFDAPKGRKNYWGYSPVSFFVPHPGYAVSADPLEQVDEFKTMVRELHRAGIEVILDVVYNHTAEGGADGPVLSMKGLDRYAYYVAQPEDPEQFANFSGCGNTLNGYHSVVRRLILDSLRYWVQDMHVDGFRFDLASILSRDSQGRPLQEPPILWDIESDPVLAGCKLIAEAWDAAGLYQVGSFVGDSWMEWNGRFRDDVRGFVRGENGLTRAVAQRLLGSPDVFAHEGREPEQSINFITCHDGFTLNDLVSYDRKHNLENGEDNRDGSNDNRSWNCGVEGPSNDAAIEALRNRQVKNLLCYNFLALGTPMIWMGDEVRRSQRGNNNAYCQDNEVGWMDWNLVEQHGDLLRFTRALIQFRLNRPLPETNLSLQELLAKGPFEWHGIELNAPDWRDISHSLAFTWNCPGHALKLHGMLNAYWEPLEFQLPPGRWLRWIDTSLPTPMDIAEPPQRAPVAERYRVESRTVAVFVQD